MRPQSTSFRFDPTDLQLLDKLGGVGGDDSRAATLRRLIHEDLRRRGLGTSTAQFLSELVHTHGSDAMLQITFSDNGIEELTINGEPTSEVRVVPTPVAGGGVEVHLEAPMAKQDEARRWVLLTWIAQPRSHETFTYSVPLGELSLDA